MADYLKEERQELILEALQEGKKVTVQELSQRFNTSEVTIRRDLHELAVNGKVRRAHRGALAVTPAPPEPPVVTRMAQEQENKEKIARAAAKLISDGESIFIGSGSTMAFLARHLSGLKRLTVVTNALNIASELVALGDEITVVVTGGVVRSPELSVLGHIAEQSLQEVRVDRVFMGVQALSLEGGWTTDHMPEVQTTRRILDMAPELVILTDHSKLDCSAAAFIAPVKRITTLITDSSADPLFIAGLEAAGVKVILAG